MFEEGVVHKGLNSVSRDEPARLLQMEYPALPVHELRRLSAVAGGDSDLLNELTRRRLSGEPLQYLEGTAAFGPLELLVDERVLIPRPETEELWELAWELVAQPRIAVDLCTGSGALALAIKSKSPLAKVYGTELSPGAAEVARLNASRLDLSIEVLEGDLFDPLPRELAGRVSLVVANPPYVSAADWENLPVDVKREPQMALVPGEDGTEILERIASEVALWLEPEGWVVCEIGHNQGDWACGWFGRFLSSVEVRRDLSGRDRFVIARLQES